MKKIYVQLESTKIFFQKITIKRKSYVKIIYSLIDF